MNRFRNPTMRREYAAVVRQFEIKHRNLFHSDGTPRKGSGAAEFFWMGYEGKNPGAGFIDRASREMLAYAYWRAGQDMKRRASSVQVNTKGE